MSSGIATTTLKCNTCIFSEMRIYPGRGIQFVSKDGRNRNFLNSKCISLFHQKVKPVKLRWTVAWRRANKKLRVSELQTKKRSHKTTKVQKAIVGLSLDELKSKRKAPTAAPAPKKPADKKPADKKPADKKPADKK